MVANRKTKESKKSLLVERVSIHLVVVDVVNVNIIEKHANDQSLDIIITLAPYEPTWNENCNSDHFLYLFILVPMRMEI